MAGPLQNNPLLVSVERNLFFILVILFCLRVAVEESRDWFIAKNCGCKNLRDVFRGYVLIENIHRINLYDGSVFTKSVASGCVCRKIHTGRHVMFFRLS